MMGGQENFIKMKARPIPKELIDKIELRVEDFEITPRERHGFEGYLLKDVLVPYINGKRRGGFRFKGSKIKNANSYEEVRYVIRSSSSGSSHQYPFNRIAYIVLNKDDPRVIETQDHYDIADNLEVDHDEDIAVQDNKFIIKPDREKNLQLLTHSENMGKAVKRMSNVPKYIHFSKRDGAWIFEVIKKTNNLPKRKSFSVLLHGWEGSYIKVIDICNKITGSNHIPDLNEAIPKEFKGMTEREFYDKYIKEYKRKTNLNYRKK